MLLLSSRWQRSPGTRRCPDPSGSGDRWGQSLQSVPQQPALRALLSEDEEGHCGTVIAWTTPWHERGEEGRGFKAHLGCQRSEQRTLNWVGVMLGLLGEA